jgi:hypothetical protein
MARGVAVVPSIRPAAIRPAAAFTSRRRTRPTLASPAQGSLSGIANASAPRPAIDEAVTEVTESAIGRGAGSAYDTDSA